MGQSVPTLFRAVHAAYTADYASDVERMDALKGAAPFYQQIKALGIDVIKAETFFDDREAQTVFYLVQVIGELAQLHHDIQHIIAAPQNNVRKAQGLTGLIRHIQKDANIIDAQTRRQVEDWMVHGANPKQAETITNRILDGIVEVQTSLRFMHGGWRGASPAAIKNELKR